MRSGVNEVLADIDGTIFRDAIDYEGGPENVNLNDPVVQLLLKNKNDKIYLFTDMTFKSSTLIERDLIIRALALKGINIAGVITPADAGWKLNAADLDEFYAIYNSRMKKDEIAANAAFQRLNKQYEEEVLNGADRLLGNAYQNCQEQLSAAAGDEKLKSKLADLSSKAKAFSEARGVIKGYEYASKGVMFEFYLKHKNAAVTSCQVIDDRMDVLNTVQAMHQNRINLQTYHVKRNGEVYRLNAAEDEKRNVVVTNKLPPAIETIKAAIEVEINLFKVKKCFFTIGFSKKSEKLQAALTRAIKSINPNTTVDEFLNSKTENLPSLKEVLNDPRKWPGCEPLWGETDSWRKIKLLTKPIELKLERDIFK